ncbi:hypothetical protein SAMN05428944_0241 [Streptomyces sp. 1222.5]|uniref:hypothetical protein n=1 Tax=unclassified Streptomyces TaxID=2593676 RepID=UPI00089B2BDD|nr:MULTISPECIES: hypothetical protein [unclassified Streptomyces]PKW12485.1 hypothetical protein BX260_7852 [Streptomyces sp. 5112.2]SEB55557.1 hypothetical protein SAMN05428944_0241 [Streptomyces sp. 1222.5]
MQKRLWLSLAAVLLVAGCSSGHGKSDGAGAGAAQAANSPTLSCTREIMGVLAAKWREDQKPVDDKTRSMLQTFMDKNAVHQTPLYAIFVKHYTDGSGPIGLAVAQGKDGEDAIVEQLAAESSGVQQDCADAD